MGIPQTNSGAFTDRPLYGAVAALAYNAVIVALSPLWTRGFYLCRDLTTFGTGANKGKLFVHGGTIIFNGERVKGLPHIKARISKLKVQCLFLVKIHLQATA